MSIELAHPIIEVYYEDGDDAFISGIWGFVTLNIMQDIDNELNDIENEFFSEGENYLKCVYEREQRGDLGRVEIPSYWRFEKIDKPNFLL